MTRTASPRLRGMAALAAGAMAAALAAGRPELAIMSLPLMGFIGIALALAAKPQLELSLEVAQERILEGQETTATVAIANSADRAVEIELALPVTGSLSVAPAGITLIRLAPEEHVRIEARVLALRWGAHRVGPVRVRARDPFGLLSWEGMLGQAQAIRAFPHEQRLRRLIAPSRTQPFLGAHLGRTRGEGIEFADVRQFVSGDRLRRINWRVTARRGSLHVSDRHPQRASDVVLLIDTFAEARGAAGATLDAAVRATASLARGHLAQRDRVALVDFGGALQWLEPAFGAVQLYRIIDALLASEIVFSYAWRAVDSLPRRVLPPQAMVVAVSPLLDERSLALLVDLRRRGRDVGVLDVSPLDYVPPPRTRAERLARRVWALQRQATRTRLQGVGIAVAPWVGEKPLDATLEEVNAFRRFARQALPA